MNLVAVLITGLFAGGVSCAAVQGGLLAGLITRQKAAVEPIAKMSQSNPPSVDRAGAETHSWRSTLSDDLAPVAGFLAGKLGAYTALGGLLGALGGAVQLSTAARTGLQLGAGLLIVAFGLAQLGVPGFRRIVIEPPASWTRLVRNRARSQAAFAPALLDGMGGWGLAHM